jgi:hypothetical protein
LTDRFVFARTDVNPELTHPSATIWRFLDFTKYVAMLDQRELRLLWRTDAPIDEPGRYLAADLVELVEQVVVSPTAEDWFGGLVRSVTAKYGFELPFAASSMLDARPEP